MAQDKDKCGLNWVPDYISLPICMKKRDVFSNGRHCMST